MEKNNGDCGEIIYDGGASVNDVINGKDGNSFNYFVATVATRVKNESLEVLVIDYASNSDVQMRISGGTFHPKDLVEAVKTCLPESHDLQKFLEVEAGFWEMRIYMRETITRDQMSEMCKKLEGRIRSECELFAEKSDEVFEKILRCSIYITCKREFKAEVEGSFSSLKISLVTLTGSHRKISVLVSGYDGPDSTEGSTESEVLRSYFIDCDTAMNKIFPVHLNLLKSGLREFARESRLNANLVTRYVT